MTLTLFRHYCKIQDFDESFYRRKYGCTYANHDDYISIYCTLLYYKDLIFKFLSFLIYCCSIHVLIIDSSMNNLYFV